MRCSKYLMILVLMLICCLHTAAQDSEYVYKDATIIAADSLTARNLEPGARKTTTDTDKEVVDTMVQNRQLTIFKDSAEGLKNDAAFKYARNLDSVLIALQKQQQSGQEPVSTDLSWIEKFFFSSVTKVFFWSLACVFIGFIVYKLFIAQGFFQRQTTSGKVAVLPDEEEHLFALTDYTKLVAQAVAGKNYPLAIRYQYLQVLQKLAAKNLIQFTPDKTNNEYIRELTGKPYRKEFASLTLNYEYAWYGKFDISEEVFADIRNRFKQFYNQL